MSRMRYQWYHKCQIECLQPIIIGNGAFEHIKKLLIIPVIEETPEKGESVGEEVDEKND